MVPESLKAERLMQHMRALCKGIGPRASTSSQEQQAAKYVKRTLGGMGVTEVKEQPFKSHPTIGWVAIPYLLLASMATPVAGLFGIWGKFAGGLALLGGVAGLRDYFMVKPVPFEKLLARRDSQNVVATIAPKGEIKKRVYLVGHLDSNKQRFTFPSRTPAIDKALNTFSLALAGAGGVSFLVEALCKREGLRWYQWLLGAFPLVPLVQSIADEMQPHIEGANDNASAVTVLLGVAEALQAQPVEHTEVTLLFTGCEEVGCVGMEHYLNAVKPPVENTYWIDIEMVGTGNLCYVTQHGISYFSQYRPAPDMVALAAQTARKNPKLDVGGKDMLILEEVANLSLHGYKAVCIAGYDEKGFLANWHRTSDVLENIEPDTLSRAAQYAWALLHEIDDASFK